MTARLKDSERTRLIAYYIRTGKNPDGYEITENESSKYKVHKIKSQLELLQAKRDRLKKQLELVEKELSALPPVEKKEEVEAKDEPLPKEEEAKEEDLEDADGDEVFMQ